MADTEIPEPGAFVADEPNADEPHDRQLRDLTRNERAIIRNHETASAKLVHEIIRLRGIEELERPFWSLLFSAIGAGFVIGLSPYAQGTLDKLLPDVAGRGILVSLGYALGFVAVISGRMQLFTESTLTAVLPLATTPNWANGRRTLRLWAIVFAGNILGTFCFALFVQLNVSHQPEIGTLIQQHAASEIRLYLTAPFFKGIPAGFLLAVLVWSMPNLERQEFWIIIAITWLMSLAQVAHCIVGSAEMWIAVLGGQVGLGTGVFGFLAPAAAGNVVGGALLFALLAHAQVKPEIADDGTGHRRVRGRGDRK